MQMPDVVVLVPGFIGVARFGGSYYRRCLSLRTTATVLGLSLLVAPLAPSSTVALDVNAAYQLVAERTEANRASFFVYQDGDSGLNHGFPSGFFGAFTKIHLNASCIDDPSAATGCSTDATRLDQQRGTVLQIVFDPLSAGEFAGVNIEEPQHWGVRQTGTGYDLTGARQIVFEARAIGSLRVQFGMAGCVTPFRDIPSSYTSFSVPITSLAAPPGQATVCPPRLHDTHLLFTVVTNQANAPDGGTILLNDIRITPPPANRTRALSFPLSTETFGVVPVSTTAGGRVPIPPDQVLRNVTTIYESALALLALLQRGMPTDLAAGQVIADAFDVALHHDNHGDELPQSAGGGLGLHNGYESGDVALLNGQGPGAGQRGDVRLAGFSASSTLCGPTGFCLVLDGATGGNNAFAALALLAAYQRLGAARYLDDARTIGRWLVEQLADTTGTGFGGYYVGYPDDGVVPKTLIPGKSIENNADIFSALTSLAATEDRLGNTSAADMWTSAATLAADFVMALFDPATGCFHAGTVLRGTAGGLGIAPTGETKGNDVINTFPFLDSHTFTMLALAGTPRYGSQIDWRRPVQCVLDRFGQAIPARGLDWQGFNIVEAPTAGPNGIAWEFTGQAVVAMRFADALYQESHFETAATDALAQMQQAQAQAPFGDGQGLVASTVEAGDTLPPLDQCLSTPFQCIPERVGLAATLWGIFADRNVNPLAPLGGCEMAATFGALDCRLDALMGAIRAATNLRALQQELLRRVRRAKVRTDLAEQASITGKKRADAALLGAAIRLLGQVVHRVQSRRGQRLIPPAIRADLVSMAEGIRTALHALREAEFGAS